MNEKRKTTGLAILCVFMLALALAGCGKTANTSMSRELNESEQADVAECSNEIDVEVNAEIAGIVAE